MANYYSYYSQTPNSFSSLLLLLSISLTFFLLLAVKKVNSAEETVSFEFTEFRKVQENLILQSDAHVVVQKGIDRLDLTITNGRSVGRVLYETPIHIWDNEKDTIASFQTNFSFAIYTPTKDKFGESLAFFLAPVDEDTHPQLKSGGLLGIFSGVESSEPIVAVEFDTFSNPWDPIGRHIGIDINSIKSTKTIPWDYLTYDYANVSISYDASTFSLTASLAYLWFSDVIYTVEESVDLRDVLPQWVRVGLSATTGDDRTELSSIYTWSFYSKLPDSSNSIGFKKTNIL